MKKRTRTKILEHWEAVKADRENRNQCLARTGPGESPYTREQNEVWELRERQLARMLLEAMPEIEEILHERAK